MSYQVLARKYRPQGFTDVVGQDAVVQTLMRALSTGRVAHAFLFTGSRGVGKTTLARILARCLTCETGPTAVPCGACRMCKAIKDGTAVDVVEIDGASNTGVDQVRDLQEMARYLPQMARFKIFIIDEVHMLTTSAFNALLKTLEEPPPHLKFIFATTEPHKIPVTVLSRCQRYDFRRIPAVTIVARLQSVLKDENVAVDKAGLEVIARAAEGGMRDALSLCDQVLSFAGAGTTDKPVAVDEVVDALGIIDRRTIIAAAEAALGGDAAAILRLIEAAFLRGHDLKQLLAAVAEEFRHLSVAQAAGSIRGFADLSDEDLARIDARAGGTDPRDVLRLLGMALDGIDVVARAEDPRLALELVSLRMCRRAPIGEALLISEALVRLEALAKGRPVPPLVVPRDARVVTPMAVAAQAFAAAAAPATTMPAMTMTMAQATSTARAAAVSAADYRDGEDEPAIADVPAFVRAPSVDEDASPDDPATPPSGPTGPVLPLPEGDVDPGEPGESETEYEDPARSLPLVGVDPRWISFVDRVARAARAVGMHLDQGRLIHADGATVEVAFARDLHLQAVAGAQNDPTIVDALQACFGPGVRLVVEKGDGTKGAPSIAEARDAALVEAQRALEAHARSHPVVVKAVALFGGEVRAVRR